MSRWGLSLGEVCGVSGADESRPAQGLWLRPGHPLAQRPSRRVSRTPTRRHGSSLCVWSTCGASSAFVGPTWGHDECGTNAPAKATVYFDRSRRG